MKTEAHDTVVSRMQWHLVVVQRSPVYSTLKNGGVGMRKDTQHDAAQAGYWQWISRR